MCVCVFVFVTCPRIVDVEEGEKKLAAFYLPRSETNYCDRVGWTR